MIPAPSHSSAPRHRWDLLVILALIASGLCIYAQTLSHPFISFDDPAYVFGNPHVNQGLTWDGWKWAWTSLEHSNWHPLTWLSLMLDAQCYGLNAGGYHLTNLLLHTVNSVLIFVWLRRATGTLWPSALTALFFVAHPLHVESVAWVTERKDVLSTLFFCLTLLAYTEYARSARRLFYAAALGCFAAGLTAKPMLVTLPPLLLLLDFWPLRRMALAHWQRLLWEKVPFCLLAAASCVVTVIAQRAEAMVPLAALPPGVRLAAALLGYGSYLTKTFFPWNLGIYYPYWQAYSLSLAAVWLAVLVIVTLGALLVCRRLPFLLVGWCWFLGTLVPVIGVVQVGGQAVADRYAYLPHIGFFIAVFWSGAAVARRWLVARRVLPVLALVATVACVASSYRQAGYWRSSAALFEHTVSVVQPNSRLYHLLGDAEIEAKQPEKAIAAYRQALRMGLGDQRAVISLSGLLLERRQWQEAADLLRPWSQRPDAWAGVLTNLAGALANDAHDDEALAVYQRCLARYPDSALAHFGLAELFQARGDVVEAAAQDEAGLSLRADWVPALNRLAYIYVQSHDAPMQESALGLARRAVNLTDGHDLGSLNVLALALAVNARWEEAITVAAQARDLAAFPGTPPRQVTACRERLAMYQQRRLPL